MLKSLVLVASVACLGLVLGSPAYTTKYDDVDLDEIIANERLFNNYYKCLMDQGPCSPDGTLLKKILPDAVANNCAECSDKQKEGAKKIFEYLLEKKQDQWKALEAKYDPNGTYKAKYDAKHKA